MKIWVVRKKASSLRELGREALELPEVSNLRELLTAAAEKEFKVSFGESYNENKASLEKAIQVMFQDFEDGLFRVYLNEREYKELLEPTELHDGDELVLIRLVMLAGRMW